MKTFEQFINENNRPGGVLMDRSLEGFRRTMDELSMQVNGIMDPQAKNEIAQSVAKFYAEMRQILLKYKNQGIGYSPNYAPHNHQ